MQGEQTRGYRSNDDSLVGIVDMVAYKKPEKYLGIGNKLGKRYSLHNLLPNLFSVFDLVYKLCSSFSWCFFSTMLWEIYLN